MADRGEPEQQPENGLWKRVAANVETAARTAAFAGVLAYVIGLFVVNAYLFRLGVSDFSLLRARLVYTGVLVLAFMAATAGWLRLVKLVIGPLWKQFAEVQGPARIWRGIWIGVVFLGTLLSPIAPFTVVLRSGAEWGDVGAAFLIFGAGSVIALVFLGLGTKADESAATPAGPKAVVEGVLRDPLAPFTLPVFVIVYLLLVAWFAYPRVPEQFGGGRPRAVSLALDGDVAASLGALDFPMSGSTSSACVDLVFVGEDSYVVRLGDDTIVEIARDAVQGVFVAHGSQSGRC